jgi:hypothetical protein
MRVLLVALVCALLTSLAYLTARPIDAAPPGPPDVSPFVGEWRAISPEPEVGDAHLSISGRAILSLRLDDPFDTLFCDSSVGHAIAVSAHGLGVISGPRTLSVFYVYRCSDGSTGFGTTTYSFSPDSPSTDSMVDSTGHFWTRVP